MSSMAAVPTIKTFTLTDADRSTCMYSNVLLWILETSLEYSCKLNFQINTYSMKNVNATVFTAQLKSPVICEEGHLLNYICP